MDMAGRNGWLARGRSAPGRARPGRVVCLRVAARVAGVAPLPHRQYPTSRGRPLASERMRRLEVSS